MIGAIKWWSLIRGLRVQCVEFITEFAGRDILLVVWMEERKMCLFYGDKLISGEMYRGDQEKK